MGTPSGTTADFPENPVDCSTFGHTFEYACDGNNTYESSFVWQALFLDDGAGGGATVFAPVVGSTTVISEVTGVLVTGETGATGPDGSLGIYYQFDGNTATNTNPGAGVIRLNDNNLSNVIAMSVSEASSRSGNVNGLLDTLTDSSDIEDARKSIIQIKNPDDYTQYAAYYVTGLITDAVGWRGYSLEYIGNNNTSFLSSNPEIFMSITPIYYGPTGPTGPIGPDGLTFSSASDNVFTYVVDRDGDPPVLGGISADVFTYVPHNSNPHVIATFLKEDPNATFTATNPALIDRNDIKNNAIIWNLDKDYTGITLQNFGTGDYISLIMKQPSESNTYSFNSVFSHPSNGEGTFHFAGGVTLPLGNEFNDVDVLYLYCYDENSFLVNHQQFHNGV